MNRQNLHQHSLRPARLVSRASLAGTRRQGRATPGHKAELPAQPQPFGRLEALWSSLGAAAVMVFRSLTIGIVDLFKADAARKLQRKIRNREIVGPFVACLIVPVASIVIESPEYSVSGLLHMGPMEWLSDTASKVIESDRGTAVLLALVGLMYLIAVVALARLWSPLALFAPWLAYVSLAAAMFALASIYGSAWLSANTRFFHWLREFQSFAWLSAGWWSMAPEVPFAMALTFVVPGAPAAVSASLYVSNWFERLRKSPWLLAISRLALVLTLSPAFSILFMWSAGVVSELAERQRPKYFHGARLQGKFTDKTLLVANSCSRRELRVTCLFLLVVPASVKEMIIYVPPTVFVLGRDAGGISVEAQLAGNLKPPILLRAGDSLSFSADLPVEGPLCEPGADGPADFEIWIRSMSTERDGKGNYKRDEEVAEYREKIPIDCPRPSLR